MATNYFSTALTKMQGYASKAFDRAQKQVGQTTNPDLQMYERLKPDDFQRLVEKHGPDAVVQYIKDMEALRTQGG